MWLWQPFGPYRQLRDPHESYTLTAAQHRKSCYDMYALEISSKHTSLIKYALVRRHYERKLFGCYVPRTIKIHGMTDLYDLSA
jgi:hypothetical protein